MVTQVNFISSSSCFYTPKCPSVSLGDWFQDLLQILKAQDAQFLLSDGIEPI